MASGEGRRASALFARHGGVVCRPMSLEHLDDFLAHARRHPELAQCLQDPNRPLEIAEFLAMAREAGFAVDEADVIAAQLRAEESLSDAELQRRAGEEARRLRHFIPG